MSLKATYTKFLQNYITPLLTSEGFKHNKSNKYSRIVNGIEQILFAASYGNKKNDPIHSFTFEIFLKDFESGFGTRLGNISKGRDHWYYLTADNADQLGELVVFQLKQYALPLFNQIKERADIEKLVQLTKAENKEYWPLRLSELFPGFGRDYVTEFNNLLSNTIQPLLSKAGFEEREGLYYKFIGKDLVQAFGFYVMMQEHKTFMNLEGVLAFFNNKEKLDLIPPINDYSAGWIQISSAYVITGTSSQYKRYTLENHTPDQMQELMKNDLEAHILPFFEQNTTAQNLEATVLEIQAQKAAKSK